MKEISFILSGYSEAGEDIALARASETDGATRLSGVRHGENPSFCCLLGDTIYAVSELPDRAAVTSYALRDGALSPLRRIELPGRRGLCHLAAIGGVLYGSCYESGHYFALDAQLSHVLWEYFPAGTPRGHWAAKIGGALYLADLGNDRLYRFALSGGLASGTPEKLPLPAGSGPRQPIALPGGGYAVVCELDGQIRFFRGDGSLLASLPASGQGGPNAPGGACLLGDTLFVGNRGPDTVSAFTLAPDGPVRRGEWKTGSWPRGLAAFADEGLLLTACSRENSVRLSRWDGEALTVQAVLPLPQASCVLPL